MTPTEDTVKRVLACCAEISRLEVIQVYDTQNANQRFENKAALFYKRYRILAPGKSEPADAHTDPIQRQALWDAWNRSGQAELDMLDEIHRLDEELTAMYEAEAGPSL